jgi:hypothetical protein
MKTLVINGESLPTIKSLMELGDDVEFCSTEEDQRDVDQLLFLNRVRRVVPERVVVGCDITASLIYTITLVDLALTTARFGFDPWETVVVFSEGSKSAAPIIQSISDYLGKPVKIITP